MDRDKAAQIANYRYSLISPIVSRLDLNPGELQAYLADAASKTYQIPFSTKTRVSERTVERYLQLYRSGGYSALIPQYLTRKTSSSRIPEEYLRKAAEMKRENMKRPIPQIIKSLEMAKEVPEGILKRSTVYDYFERIGINREVTKAEAKAFQRFTPKHRNQRWQGDTCHLVYLPDPEEPDKLRKVYLIAWLDEYSRMITHAQCYWKEKSYSLEDCLKKAMLKHGIPVQLYVDNGKIYSSTQMESICGRLGVHLSHTRPYKPQGRGKVERLFRSIQSSFLPEIEVLLRERPLSLAELNNYLFLWIRQHYHEKAHSATKEKPLLRFENDLQPIRTVSLAELEDAFLVEDTRTTDKTGVFHLNSLEFQAELALARKKVLVRYNPYDLSSVQIYFEGCRYEDASVLNVPEQIDYHVGKKEEDVKPPNSGINYLQLLKEDDEGKNRVSFASVPKEG